MIETSQQNEYFKNICESDKRLGIKLGKLFQIYADEQKLVLNPIPQDIESMQSQGNTWEYHMNPPMMSMNIKGSTDMRKTKGHLKHLNPLCAAGLNHWHSWRKVQRLQAGVLFCICATITFL